VLNQIVIVGKVESFNSTTWAKDTLILKVKVDRAYKDEHGNYDTDLIPILVEAPISQNIETDKLQGSLIGIKGHIRIQHNMTSLIADKLSFLTLKGTDDDATPSGENHA